MPGIGCDETPVVSSLTRDKILVYNSARKESLNLPKALAAIR